MIRRGLARFYRVLRAGSSDPAVLMAQKIEGYRRLGVVIGDNCWISRVRWGREGIDPIRIGNNCVLTSCTILGHDASPAMFMPELQGTGMFDRVSMVRETVIHDDCFIALGAIVLCGVQIGPRAIVGAGAVVTDDVPPNSVAAGNPAKVVCSVEEFVANHRERMRTHPAWYPGAIFPPQGDHPSP